jgi:hypothetical protein
MANKNKFSVGIIPSNPGLRLVSVAQDDYLSKFNAVNYTHCAASFFGLMESQSEPAGNMKISGPCHGALKNFSNGLYVIGSALIRGAWYLDKTKRAKAHSFFDWYVNRSVFSAAFDVAVDKGDGSEPVRQTVDNMMENGVWVRTDIDSRIMLGALQGTRYPYGVWGCVDMWHLLAIENGIEPSLAFYFANLCGLGPATITYTGDHCPLVSTISLGGFQQFLKGEKTSDKTTYEKNVDYSFIFDLWSDDGYGTNGQLKEGQYVYELLKKYPTVFRTQVVQSKGWASKGPPTFKCHPNQYRTNEELIALVKQEQEWWNTHLNTPVDELPIEPYVASRWDGLPYPGGRKSRQRLPAYWTVGQIQNYFETIGSFYPLPTLTGLDRKETMEAVNKYMDAHPDEWEGGKMRSDDGRW